MNISCKTVLVLGLLLMSAAPLAASPGKGEVSAKVAEKSTESKTASPPKIEAGTQMLLMFPSVPSRPPFTAAQLSLFRSSLSRTDRLGILIADRKQQLLSLSEADQVAITSEKIMEGLQPEKDGVPAETALHSKGNGLLDANEMLRSAVAQLSDLNDLLKVIVLVLDRPVSISVPPTNEADSGSSASLDLTQSTGASDDAGVSALGSVLALNNVLLYTVYYDDVSNPAIEALTTQSGGKNIYLSRRVSLNDALYMAYDSILLRTIQLAPQTALYESDTVCTPPAEVPIRDSLPPPVKKRSVLENAALGMLGGILFLNIAMIVLFWMNRKKTALPASPSGEKAAVEKEKAAPSFSKLNIGMNRLRNSFAEAEERLHALSGDLDDFGSDNWEMQKKILTAYAEIAKELFLLFDHACLTDDASKTGADDWLKRKLTQVFENNGISEIAPVSGERFHSKFHVHVGERESDEKAGTILEVARNGYQRVGFISDEPFVIRQAEVIVSSGPNKGK